MCNGVTASRTQLNGLFVEENFQRFASSPLSSHILLKNRPRSSNQLPKKIVYTLPRVIFLKSVPSWIKEEDITSSSKTI